MELNVCFYLLYRVGPLTRFWCMRYESKHNYFKNLAHRVKCFKNIPQTLLYHHQRLLCLYANSNKDYMYEELRTGSCEYHCHFMVNMNDKYNFHSIDHRKGRTTLLFLSNGKISTTYKFNYTQVSKYK